MFNLKMGHIRFCFSNKIALKSSFDAATDICLCWLAWPEIKLE